MRLRRISETFIGLSSSRFPTSPSNPFFLSPEGEHPLSLSLSLSLSPRLQLPSCHLFLGGGSLLSLSPLLLLFISFFIFLSYSPFVPYPNYFSLSIPFCYYTSCLYSFIIQSVTLIPVTYFKYFILSTSSLIPSLLFRNHDL